MFRTQNLIRGIASCARLLLPLMAAGAIGAFAVPAQGQNVTPPDLTVCNGVATCEAPDSVCSGAGFKITLTGFSPAPATTSGVATYTYQICSPAPGTCSNDATKSCLDNSQCQTNRCQKGGQNPNTCSQDNATVCTTDADCNTGITCSRECPANVFRGLSHFDVTFPELGGVGSCLPADTVVTGTCAAVDNTPTDGHTASVGAFVLGDGSCFTSTFPVAKCDNTEIAPGDCITMTLQIPGENNQPNLGAAVVVDKEATTCTASCMQGPSCEPCVPPPPAEQCLTRTLGFWGTHPWITNDFDPVTVCGQPLDCNDAPDGKSNPSCGYGQCNDIMEGLGSIGGESNKDASYISMVKQLTAAKLNLNATAALFNGATCASWKYQDKTIQEWIGWCESLCGTSKAVISGSGCIEALDAFNNSQDTGFTVTPAPFNRPPVDDYGNISGADPSSFTAAGKSGVIVGKKCPAPVR